MKKFEQWLGEYESVPGSLFRAKKTLPDKLKDLDKKTQPQPQPVKVGYDAQEEDLVADLIHSLQSLLDVLDLDRSDLVSIQQWLAKINHQGNVYLKNMGK